MPKIHQFLTEKQIINEFEALDTDELIDLTDYAAETRGDDAYRMKVSEWFRKRRLKARAPRPARAAGGRR